MRDAVIRAARLRDSYAWAHAHCLDALAGAMGIAGDEETEAVIEQLERIAGHGDMRELVVRAAMHRARLGDASAGATARLLAESIDNPRLHRELGTA